MHRLILAGFFRNVKKNKLFSIINGLGLTTGITAFLIALISISYHCFKTAFSNPIKALKAE